MQATAAGSDQCNHARQGCSLPHAFRRRQKPVLPTPSTCERGLHFGCEPSPCSYPRSGKILTSNGFPHSQRRFWQNLSLQILQVKENDLKIRSISHWPYATTTHSRCAMQVLGLLDNNINVTSLTSLTPKEEQADIYKKIESDHSLRLLYGTATLSSFCRSHKYVCLCIPPVLSHAV